MFWMRYRFNALLAALAGAAVSFLAVPYASPTCCQQPDSPDGQYCPALQRNNRRLCRPFCLGRWTG